MEVHIYSVKAKSQAGKIWVKDIMTTQDKRYNDNDNLMTTSRLWNTGLVSSGASLTSWGECASLALVHHPSSDGVTINMPYGVDILHRPASHPIFSYWVG